MVLIQQSFEEIKQNLNREKKVKQEIYERNRTSLENISIAQERNAYRRGGVKRHQKALKPIEGALDSRAMYPDPNLELGGLGDDFALMEPAKAIQKARDR